MRRLAGLLLIFSLALLPALPLGAYAEDDVAEPVGKVLTLPAKPGPHWFWLSDVILHRTALYDGDSGKMLGTINAGTPGVGFTIWPLFSPDHREIYIPESYFSRGVRGDRTDVVTIYDGQTLMPTAEIPIPPKRAEYFPGVAPNAISDDGRFVAIFNVTPAQSLSIVDVAERRFTTEIQTPGCSLVYSAGPRRFFMLCADGAALVVTLDDAGQQVSAERTEPFFDAEQDPVFEAAGRHGDGYLFASFEGYVHPVDVSGEKPRFGEKWSLLSDAERSAGWRIGGGQPVALHAATGRLYLLMHEGPKDSHKQPGTEIWVYDVATRNRVAEIPVNNPLSNFLRGQMRVGREGFRDRLLVWLLDAVLPNTGAEAILVTQDAQPVLVVMSMLPPALTVHDAQTGAILHEIAEPGIAGSVLVAP
ncbi:MAG TPA: amine dehydrogenase large subunit [Candidatus Binatia bacterium]